MKLWTTHMRQNVAISSSSVFVSFRVSTEMLFNEDFESKTSNFRSSVAAAILVLGKSHLSCLLRTTMLDFRGNDVTSPNRLEASQRRCNAIPDRLKFWRSFISLANFSGSLTGYLKITRWRQRIPMITMRSSWRAPISLPLLYYFLGVSH